MERVWVIIANSEDGYGGPGNDELLGFWTTEEAASSAIAALMDAYASDGSSAEDETPAMTSLRCVELENGERLDLGGREMLERQRTENIVKFVPRWEWTSER